MHISTHEAEISRCEMGVEGKCDPDLEPHHDRKACRIHRRQFMQIPAAKIGPSMVQIGPGAFDQTETRNLIQGFLPQKRGFSRRISVDKGECFEDDRKRRAKFRT